MRRQELQTEDPALLDQVLALTGWGLLSLPSDDAWPYAVPVNHVCWEGSIWVHGAGSGRRFSLVREPAAVQFTVVREQSLIPSYALGGDLACPATQFFQSVMVWGEARYVTDLDRKAQVLQAFMQRLQPEGRHAPIDAGDPRYLASLKATHVLEIRPHRRTGKFKFGQNMGDAEAEQVMAFLESRQQPGDLETVGWMRRMRRESSD